MLKKYYINFSLQQIMNCINIANRMDKNNNLHDFNLKLSPYYLVKGFIENKELVDIKDKFALNNLKEITGQSPFIIQEKLFLQLSNIIANKEIKGLKKCFNSKICRNCWNSSFRKLFSKFIGFKCS